jgi:Domain of unknown function (DUF4129)
VTPFRPRLTAHGPAPDALSGWPRLGVLAALLVVLAGGVALIAPLAARAASPAEYRAAVATALATAEAAADADEASRAAALSRVSDLLATGVVVEVGGRSIATANPPLQAALAAGDLSAVRAQLTALLAALDAAAAAPSPPPDAQAKLADVLARAEFQPPEPGPLTRLLQPLIEALRPPLQPVIALWEAVQLAWERFWRWVGSLFEGSTGGGDLRWLFLALGGLVVLGLGALILGAFAGNVVGGAQAAAAPRRGRPSAAATRARAQVLAASGDYRAAIHELYLATLLALDDRHLLRYRADLTNREHLVAGQISLALAVALEPLVEMFDRLWYSGALVGPDDWTRFVALADGAQAVTADDSARRMPAADAPALGTP